MGDVIGDINSRRGMVGELGERGNMKARRTQSQLGETVASPFGRLDGLC